ncbi:MAG TPA: GGDEF domain-containing protein, partial [Tabrizicola sp.]|nr:GGDEF domain-containing protein [Tabrizicola sp.]
VIVVGRTDPKVLQTIAERIIARICEPMNFEGKSCLVSGSIGIVRSLDLEQPEPTQILATSDRALYAAKHAGRGRAVLLVARGA